MKDQAPIWDIEYLKNKNKWHFETKSLPNILKNKNILELGLGNSKTLSAILKQKPKSVTAIDFSQVAIDNCNKIFKNKNLKIIKADVKDIPLKDKEFDIVVCYYIFNNLIEKERILAASEVYRVLKPKGVVLFEDFSVGDFRETEKDNKIIEKHTIENKKGIIQHFFTKEEVKFLFNNFKLIKLDIKTSSPITHKPNLKRKIVSATFTKD